MRKRSNSIIIMLMLTVPRMHALQTQKGQTNLAISPHMYVQQTFKMPSIPSPLVVRKEAGQYLPQLEKLQQLLKEEKHIEFYDEFPKIWGETRRGWEKEEKTRVNSAKEMAVAREWALHYCLNVPLLTHEKIEENRNRLPYFFYTEDFSLKIAVCKDICEENTKEVAELLGVDEKRLLKDRIETIAATLIFLNKVYLYAKDEKKLEREDAFLWKKHEEEEKLSVELYPEKQRGDFTTPEGYIVRDKLRNRRIRRSGMKKNISSMRLSMMDKYIRKLALCFPNQGRVVQEYVKKTGFHVSPLREYFVEARQLPIEFDIAILLRHAIERTPETEWLFKGLPSKERIEAMDQKKTKDVHARVAREMEEHKRLEKKKAEELAKKQAEEARREAEAARRAAAQVNPATPPSPQ